MPKASTKTAKKLVATVATKAVSHNKKFPVKRVSRTKMVQMINTSGGRFFTSTHVDKDGHARTMNAVKPKGQPGELGYILVRSIKEGFRNINPQTLTDLSFGGVHYKASK